LFEFDLLAKLIELLLFYRLFKYSLMMSLVFCCLLVARETMETQFLGRFGLLSR
jgi:hypothetical protein